MCMLLVQATRRICMVLIPMTIRVMTNVACDKDDDGNDDGMMTTTMWMTMTMNTTARCRCWVLIVLLLTVPTTILLQQTRCYGQHCIPMQAVHRYTELVFAKEQEARLMKAMIAAVAVRGL